MPHAVLQCPAIGLAYQPGVDCALQSGVLATRAIATPDRPREAFLRLDTKTIAAATIGRSSHAAARVNAAQATVWRARFNGGGADVSGGEADGEYGGAIGKAALRPVEFVQEGDGLGNTWAEAMPRHERLALPVGGGTGGGGDGGGDGGGGASEGVEDRDGSAGGGSDGRGAHGGIVSSCCMRSSERELLRAVGEASALGAAADVIIAPRPRLRRTASSRMSAKSPSVAATQSCGHRRHETIIDEKE